MAGRKKKEVGGGMWLTFRVELQMTGRFAASLPRTREQITAMLEQRKPLHPPEDFVPIDDLAEEVASKVAPAEGEEDHEVKFGWATFPRDDNGLYYEGRCIRGHLKDYAAQIRQFIKPEVKDLKAKVSNKVCPTFFALGDKAVHLETGGESGVSVTPLNVPSLRGHLKKMADFVAFGGPHQREKPVVVPRTMLEDILEVKRPPLLPLVGV